MIPRRFSSLRPYFASLIHPRFKRPPVREMIKWLTQPDKEQRASKYIREKRQVDDYTEIFFSGHDHPFYYPLNASWVDLCQTIDECFNPANWHHFISSHTPVGTDDVVIDCGAAEGLFSFVAANHAKKVYAIEPIASWHKPMDRTFRLLGNVEVLKVGVGHKTAMMRMTNDEIYSKVSATGDLEIQIATLDSLFADKNIEISFLKADVEGFEFPMLLGAEKLIRLNRPKVSVTVYHNSNHFIEIMEYLKDLHSDYQFNLRGIAGNGNPVLLQAY